ncbi:MAG: hypothetical protein WC718_00210 [Phycisphaerales bacterium]|jgi:hypothetical protein
MNPVVVNVGNGSWYSQGSVRLRDSVYDKSPGVDVLQWFNELPPGAPSHEESPYGFKVFAIHAAIAKGYRFILWLDSAAVVQRPLDPLFDIVRRVGWYFQHNGYVLGEWSSDAALEKLGVTREDAMGMEDLVGGCFALDVKNPVAREFLDRITTLAMDGVTFKGPWTNTDGACSSDPRVRGHRHDQVAMSIVSRQMGMAWTPSDQNLFCNGIPHDRVPERYLISNFGM